MQLLHNRRAADLKLDVNEKIDVNEADLRAAEPKKGFLSFFLAGEELASLQNIGISASNFAIQTTNDSCSVFTSTFTNG
jgi:hypothetical protein